MNTMPNQVEWLRSSGFIFDRVTKGGLLYIDQYDNTVVLVNSGSVNWSIKEVEFLRKVNIKIRQNRGAVLWKRLEAGEKFTLTKDNLADVVVHSGTLVPTGELNTILGGKTGILYSRNSNGSLWFDSWGVYERYRDKVEQHDKWVNIIPKITLI